jgi:hypothetical protein
MSDQSIASFWINIAAGVVLLALHAILKFAHARLANGNPTYRKFILIAIGVCWVVLNAAYVYLFKGGGVLFLSSAALVWIIYCEFSQFWRIGLVGADRQIRSGIDFQKALRLVSNSFDFLGIGAAKLTSERVAFEEAIARCNRPDRPVRFLLCKPDNQELQYMAQSADQGRESYQNKVQESLRMIADLRNKRAWHIQVRFYKEFPTFRLMFIDDSLCLASHYVLGKGSGADLPQLHIVRLRGARDIDSLYYAFNSYFERFWKDAEEWDFKQYIE